jgi:hypothetical protein
MTFGKLSFLKAAAASVGVKAYPNGGIEFSTDLFRLGREEIKTMNEFDGQY